MFKSRQAIAVQDSDRVVMSAVESEALGIRTWGGRIKVCVLLR